MICCLTRLTLHSSFFYNKHTMESGEAGIGEVQPKNREKRIEPHHPHRITGPTRVRFGSSQFLAIPSERPGDERGKKEYNLFLYSLDANGNLEIVDGEPKREWLNPGDTIGRGEDNTFKLPEGNLLASRNHAKVTFGVEHQGKGASNRVKNLLGRAGGPNVWAITDVGSKNGTFVTKVDPRSLPPGL